MFARVTVLLCVSSLLSFTDTATAQRNGDLRLARGSLTTSSYSSGRLEIYINGQWGTVCDDSFTFTDAKVACRQLGYSSGFIASTSYGSGSGPIWLDDVGCTGSESCLLSCTNRGIGSHNCFHFEDVAISCSGSQSTVDCSFISTTSATAIPTIFTSAPKNGDLRLARGSITSSSYSSGRLEIYTNGQWGTVCDDSFTSTDANIACRQLGFTGGSTTSISLYGGGSGPIWLDDVGCSGIESCLLSCSNRGIGVEDCRHSEDVAISCSGTRFTSIDCSIIASTASSTENTTVFTSAPRNGDLRLARGSITSRSYSSGRLEIYINGQWGTVCDDFFANTDANVACRQLGFTGGSITSTSYGDGFGPIWLDDVDCSGGESCILSCSNRGIGSHNCAHYEDVVISCSGTRFSSTDCSFSGASVVRILGIIVGVTVGLIVLFVVIPIVICVVWFCCVAGGVGAASPRRPRIVTTPASAATTATIVTTGSQQAAGTEKQPPPPYTALRQPPPPPYTAQKQPPPPPYTAQKQPPPPAYTAQPIEMSTYPPQSQTAYPPQPQTVHPTPYQSQLQEAYPEYPPQGCYQPDGGYHPESGYPSQ